MPPTSSVTIPSNGTNSEIGFKVIAVRPVEGLRPQPAKEKWLPGLGLFDEWLNGGEIIVRDRSWHRWGTDSPRIPSDGFRHLSPKPTEGDAAFAPPGGYILDCRFVFRHFAPNRESSPLIAIAETGIACVSS